MIPDIDIKFGDTWIEDMMTGKTTKLSETKKASTVHWKPATWKEIEIRELIENGSIKISYLPQRYIINKNATILFWADGGKTIVKRKKKDKFDKITGFLWAYFEKTSGLSKTQAHKYLESLETEEE